MSVDVYWPYYLGSDNPISYLFEQIAPFISESQFEMSVFREVSEPVVGVSHLTEQQTMSFDTWRGRIDAIRTGLRSHDLIHTGGIPLLHLPVALSTHARNPSLSHVHTFRVDVDPDSEFPTWARRRLGRMADFTTAVSEHTADTVADTFGVRPKVIYNGVNTELFHPQDETPELYHQFGDKPIFLFVGTFEQRKRPLDVVEVANQIPEAEFVLIGGGGRDGHTDKVLTAVEDVENVHFIGRVPKHQLPSLYSNASGLLFPSIREGCPNVVMEAMASETPVVGYDATSMPELITDGETGFLVKPEDTEGLAQQVRAVIADSSNRLGKNARKYVTTNHTFDVIAEEYESLYRELEHS